MRFSFLCACRALAACLALVGLVVVLSTVATPALAAPPASPPLAAAKQTFHIEAGDASFTLNEFSRQSTLQLLFDYNLVRGRKTRAISGEFEPKAALEQMLTDTGLVFDFVNKHTLAVTVSAQQGTSGAAIAEVTPNSRGRTQAAAETQSVAHEGAGSAEPAIDPRALDLEEITILGTHVHGEEPPGEHVVSLGREADINPNPNATVQDLLRSIPQTFGGGPTEDTHYFTPETFSNSGLGAGINLRGLGAGSTLVLINGKRMAPSGTEAAFSDVESIPLAAVERIDVLSDGASALYGSDAVGGVVNFVMRDNFTGSETTARGGSGTQSTLDEYRIAQTLGTHWDSGNGMVSLEFYKRGDLPASARRYANSDLTSLGGSNFDTFLTNPGNIVIGGRPYAIPAGQNGTQLTVGDLNPNAPNQTDRYQDADILPSQKRWSLYASGKNSLTDTFSLFGTALVSRREAQQLNGGVQANVPVPSTNAFYPGGLTAPVTVVEYNFLDDIGAQHTDVIVNNINMTLGLNIKVGAAWKMSLYGNYAQEHENQLITGVVDQAALSRALADSNPATALNVFGDGSFTNPATLKALATSNHFVVDSKLRTLNATADGPIAHLPGGDVKLALGVDRRNQVLYSANAATSATPAIEVSDSRNVTGGFAELRIPLFDKPNSRMGLRKLELSIAGRYEDYSDFGSAATPKLGMTWSPFNSLALRGSWGHSISAPALSYLDTGHNILASTVLPDNASSNGFSHALIQEGNRPNINAQRANTWTGGLDIDATQWISGLTFSTTYFNIHFKDRVQQLTPTATMLNDPAFATLITRSPTQAQIDSACSGGTYSIITSGTTCAQSGPGVILDLRNQNLASVRTSGVDLSAVYEQRWAPGTLRFRLDGTYLFDFTEQVSPDAQPLRALDTQNNPINIKLRGLVTWQQLHWGATLGINFQNHYTDTVSVPNRTISSFTTFDAQLRYIPPTFGMSPLQNMSIELNAINVFNSSPPFLNNATAGLGYDQENADPLGRLLSIQVRKSW